MAEQDEQVLMTEMERNSTGVSTQSMDQSDSGGANNPDKSQAVKTDDSNPQANGIGGDNEQGEAGPSNDSQVVLETETGLDKVESIDQFEYIEPVPDPYNKAIKYLEQHSILQLFQNLTADIVYNRPPDPIDYMIAEIEVIKKNRDLVETEAKPPQNTSNVSQDV